VKIEHKSEEQIFNAAVQFESRAERDAYVAKACGDDQRLLENVQALLQYHDANSFLDAPILEPDLILDESPLTEGPGTIVGRYKLLEQIGEGGMAVVYMAEQQKPIRRKVALKIIKLGMDTKSVIARFEAERQALALMDHPNIAKVFDAGATDTGRPYFVMELVTGVSITEYCDKNRISIKERLKLFTSICNAIHHAHLNGIIHRDIKPSNNMVTLHDGIPVPKVIDFGISKAINQRLTEKTLFTHYAHMVGTPAYMSPEQAEMSGLGVDTRTDIYSLGVLLYELLTGTTPFEAEELHKASLSEMQRIICEQEPTKPSTKLKTLKESITEITGYRQTNPDTLSGLVCGDLDWIVMKCLEKDRTRRYETMHGLVEDIERHLKNEPILAHAPNLMYLAQKFWRRRRPHIVTTAVVTVLLAGLIVTTLLYQRSVNAQKIQWARGVALPEIIKLVEQQDYSAAFTMANRAKQYIPEDLTLTELWSRICMEFSITTVPAGADIYCREYDSMDDTWQFCGQSPLENITLPQYMYRWRIEKEGFDIHECVAEKSFDVRLHKQDPSCEMVWISGVYDDHGKVIMPEFLIDKYEVTNEKFKAFVDTGGYENAGYWEGLEFVKDKHRLSWHEAMTEFRDRTGQPGPATWEEGNYPEGKDEHPVSGVSWFEANAYAKFVGKSVPTLHHWEHAACLWKSLVITPYSNFAINGMAPVGSHIGMGQTGLYDMAGNVKEWCWNATDDSGSHRYILGGGWGEQTYMFTRRDFRSPWDRAAVNGFRCVQYVRGEESVADVLFHPMQQPPETRDYSTATPCTDEEFRIIQRQYDCDRTPLNAAVEIVNESSPFWRRKEKITFDAAYGGERMIAYLFIPKGIEPPYQTVVYWPGDGATREESFQDLPERDYTEFIITNGRALLFPVYKGTFERRHVERPDMDETPAGFTEWIIQTCKDLRRSLDYLETRADIDSDRIAYYGMSAGASFGPMVLAVEHRFKAAVLVVGGFPIYLPVDTMPAIDPVNHAPRVKTPVLMVNGEGDFFFPLESSQKPMYEALGTPEAHTKHRVYPGGHGLLSLFSKQIRGDVLGWLDRYLGPVNGTKNDMK
jgi:serine/threonine protein kinase/dienelactone hydrolase